MSTLGKILLVVNFFVAAGLAYLIAQDWAARQVRLRRGRALGPDPRRPAGRVAGRPPTTTCGWMPRSSGLHVVETVRPKMLANHFQGVTAGRRSAAAAPPKSQVEELQRVQSKVAARLGAAAGPVERLALLAGRYDAKGAFTPGWLAAMAESYDERTLVRSLAEAALPPPGQQALDPQALEEAVKTAEAMLRRRFEAALAKPNPQLAAEETAKVKELSEAVRTADAAAREANKQFVANPMDQAAAQKLTETLTALEQALRDQKQFLTTLGNSAAARRAGPPAADRAPAGPPGPGRGLAEAGRPGRRAADVRRGDPGPGQPAAGHGRRRQQQVVLDQAEFSETYEVLKSLANERALLLAQQSALTADLATQRTRDREAVTLRGSQLQRRQEDLKSLQDQVAAALTRQAEVEQGLLSVQKQVAETQQGNLELLKQVDAAEQKK